MLVFLKAQASSLLATVVDFLTTIVLVELFALHYVAASATGALAGAVVNFSMNRNWAFNAKKTSVQNQSLRYAMVWTGSLLLNTSGLFFMTHFMDINYVLSKIIISVAVGIGFNYTLQKKYVFTDK